MNIVGVRTSQVSASRQQCKPSELRHLPCFPTPRDAAPQLGWLFPSLCIALVRISPQRGEGVGRVGVPSGERC